MKAKLQTIFWAVLAFAAALVILIGLVDLMDGAGRLLTEAARIEEAEAAWQESAKQEPPKEANRLWVVETGRGTALSVAPNSYEAKWEAERATREYRAGGPRELDLGLKERGAVILGGRP